MLDCNFKLTQPITSEYITAFSYSRSLKSYKGKTVPVPNHNTMSLYGGHGNQAPCILDAHKWSASYSGHFHLREGASGTH